MQNIAFNRQTSTLRLAIHLVGRIPYLETHLRMPMEGLETIEREPIGIEVVEKILGYSLSSLLKSTHSSREVLLWTISQRYSPQVLLLTGGGIISLTIS